MATVSVRRGTRLLAVILLALITYSVPRTTGAAPALLSEQSFKPAEADLVGLDLTNDTLRTSDDAIAHPALGGLDVPSGIATWPPLAISPRAVETRLDAFGEGLAELEVRASSDGANWSEWVPAGGEQRVQLPSEAFFIQVRAILSGVDSHLDGVFASLFEGDASGDQLAAQAATNPTVRVWATREGLVGGRTANGHRIVERDRFVALPSRRPLARIGGHEYQVKLRYKSKEATAPVWDVGPWNTRDNYWDAPADRDAFKDLPRFTPQALAAWKDGHNGGRDEHGRWVTYPASIDIADGTFWDDLGMTSSDWVDVTFTWVNAPSPAPSETPKVVMKPAPATVGQTPPKPAGRPKGQRWYFAEGSTRDPFQTWLLVQNPNREAVQATITYMLVDGSTRTQSLSLKPTSRASVFVNQVVPDAEFSVRIDADRPVFTERAMYFRQDGHTTAATQQPEKRWCFANGITRDGNDTWLLLQNPGDTPASVNIGLMLEGGGLTRRSLDIPKTSRRSVYLNQLVPDASFAGCVESDQPIIAERTGYTAVGGGNGGMLVPGPSKTWYFAEASSHPGVDTTLSLGNPGAEASTVDVKYLVEGGEPKTRSVTVPPMGQVRVDPEQDVAGKRYGIALSASQPVVAERSTTFGPGNAGTHSSIGSSTLSRVWHLAEGSTSQPFQEYVLVANPGGSPTTVTAQFMRDDGSLVSKTYPLPAGGRLTVDANAEVPNAAISVSVRSDQPVVVERAMYWGNLAGGSTAVGVPWDG